MDYQTSNPAKHYYLSILSMSRADGLCLAMGTTRLDLVARFWGESFVLVCVDRPALGVERCSPGCAGPTACLDGEAGFKAK